MTVIELMRKLLAYQPDAEVKFFDTYWEGEGWGPHAKESRWNEIIDVYEDEDGTILIR